MKNTLLCLLCSAFLGNLYAQTFAYNFPGDFDSAPSAFVRKADGRFLIAGTTGGPSSSFTYSSASKGYILDWDAAAGLLNSKQLEIYGESRLYDMLELANGNIVTSGWDNFCSKPNITLIYVKCFDPAGNLLWTSYTDTIPKNPTWANINTIQLAVRPGDGKVAQVFNAANTGTVNLLDPDKGKILFKSVLLERYNGLAVNPVNNNLVLIRSSAITQINPDNGQTITQYDLLPVLSARYNHVLIDAAGTIWAISNDYATITKWALNKAPTNLTVPNIWSGIQWVVHGSGFAEYRHTDTAGDFIHFFDANFQLQSVVKLPNLVNFKFRKMYLDTNTIFLAGFEEHGPKANTYGSGAEEASSNLLIRRFGYDGLPQETEDPDIAVTGAKIEVPPVITQPTGASTWQIIGGKYALTVRNNGNIPVHEVHILSSDIGIFEYDNDCYIKDKRHFNIHLQNIHLAPGEETVVTIDSLNIVSAAYLSWSLCFWTATPNQRRDLDYSNDYACLKLFAPVPTEEPTQTTAELRVIPNPATAAVRIVLSAARGHQDAYRIISSSGRLLQQGVIPAGAGEFSVEIEDLPVGVYFVEAGGVFGRFVKL